MKQGKQNKSSKYDTEIKKVAQEHQHATKMVQKWTEKEKRKGEKLHELHQLAILDCCEKKEVDYFRLRDILDNLPNLEEQFKENEVFSEESVDNPEETEETQENMTEDEPKEETTQNDIETTQNNEGEF